MAQAVAVVILWVTTAWVAMIFTGYLEGVYLPRAVAAGMISISLFVRRIAANCQSYSDDRSERRHGRPVGGW
jgi:hypothetical protein